MHPDQHTADPIAGIAESYGSAGVASGMDLVAPPAGQTGINIFGGVITAQKVAAGRDLPKVLVKMRALAAMAGESWVYRWEVKNNRTGRKDTIEGGTIKLANDLAREWGNCQVDCRVVDEGPHWIFYGRFVDLETGFSLTRPYQQRKSANIGMKDQQRALDMMMGIGTSKCIRNVVLNALQSMTEYCLDLADNVVKKKIGDDPEKCRAYIDTQLEKMGVDVVRVERTIGVALKNFSVPQMAKVYSEIKSVTEGMVMADDIWPIEEAGDGKDAGGADGQKPQPTQPQRREEPPAQQARRDPERPPAAPLGQERPRQEPPVEDRQRIETSSGGRGDNRDEGGTGDPGTVDPETVIWIVQNERGVPIGKLDQEPEIGKEMEISGLEYRVVEVGMPDNPYVVVKLKTAAKPLKEPEAPRMTAAQRAKAAAEKARGQNQPQGAAAPQQQQRQEPPPVENDDPFAGMNDD